MGLIFFILIVFLIVQIGFWNTLGAILGAAVMFVLVGLIAVATVVIAVMMLLARLGRS